MSNQKDITWLDRQSMLEKEINMWVGNKMRISVAVWQHQNRTTCVFWQKLPFVYICVCMKFWKQVYTCVYEMMNKMIAWWATEHGCVGRYVRVNVWSKQSKWFKSVQKNVPMDENPSTHTRNGQKRTHCWQNENKDYINVKRWWMKGVGGDSGLSFLNEVNVKASGQGLCACVGVLSSKEEERMKCNLSMRPDHNDFLILKRKCHTLHQASMILSSTVHTMRRRSADQSIKSLFPL